MITKEDIAKVVSLKKSAMGIRDAGGVIKYFVDKVRPKTILEIGTYKGATSLFLSQLCEQVITIDILDGKLEREGKLRNPVREELWEKFGAKNIYFQPVKCNHSKARIINKLDFEFAFIDGDHSYEGVKLDFELVKKCGNVLFHDYDFSNRPKRDAVWNFVNSLDNIESKDIFAFWSKK